MRLQHLVIWSNPVANSTVFSCIGERTRHKLQEHLTPDKVKGNDRVDYTISRPLAETLINQGAKRLYVRWGESGPNWVSPLPPPPEAEQVKAALASLAEYPALAAAQTPPPPEPPKLSRNRKLKVTKQRRYHRLIRWPIPGNKGEMGTVYLVRGSSLRISYAKHIGGYDDNLTNADPTTAQNMVDLGAELLYVSWEPDTLTSDSGWVVTAQRPDNDNDTGIDDGDEYDGATGEDPYAHLGASLDDDDDDDWRPKTLTFETLDAARAKVA